MIQSKTQFEVKPVLVTVREAATMIGCSVSMVWKMNKNGSFPPRYKIGHATRWKADDINLFISSSCSGQ